VATLFNRSIEAVTESAPSYAPDGSYVPGAFSVRNVRGTVQPVSGMETVPAVAASRNTGTAKVYSSELLAFPNGEHDDRVDATTQALDTLATAGGGSVLDFL